MTTQQRQIAARPYRKRKRAVSELETRQRITEAALALHQTVGPARTSVKAIAERARVDRATVYQQSRNRRLISALMARAALGRSVRPTAGLSTSNRLGCGLWPGARRQVVASRSSSTPFPRTAWLHRFTSTRARTSTAMS